MTTPARRQYLRIKKEHLDEILLFRMGDFYETFDDDARTVSRELEIALTSREMGKGQRIPLAGIPYHSLDAHLARLIKKGYRVAICEQTSDPLHSRGLIDREVVRVVTPGTVTEDSVLKGNVNNYLSAVVIDRDAAGLAYADITTGEFATTVMPLDRLATEIGRLEPAEIIVPENQDGLPFAADAALTPVTPDAFHPQWARETLLDHFGAASLEAYGCERMPLAVRAAGAVVDYLGSTQRGSLTRIASLQTYSTDAYMVLDPQTRRNLELFEGGRWGEHSASLTAALDRTGTPMGGRLLRRWIGQPLLDVEQIVKRQDAVSWFHRSALRRERVAARLEVISDLERLVGRILNLTATPRDLSALERGLRAAPEIRQLLEEDDDRSLVDWLAAGFKDTTETASLIGRAIAEDPPISMGEGRVIRRGFSPELDDLLESSRSARDYIASLEKRERERTGVKSLKVGYNRVFGYYIEVSNPNLSKVPDDYVRRQTLVGGERFITPEMKEYETRILNAQERIEEMEASLFRQVCRQVSDASAPITATARAVARTDVFASLAEVASLHGYARPDVDDGPAVQIKGGRHPMVERTLPSGTFVPNDSDLSTDDEQVVLLTGPNMAGKSTYIRQVALIVLMAQIGSYVPADSARVGAVDRIFTRVGLQDDLSVGQSTFMVEMVETAAILNHATARSLIVLDEIGRGTSTYDGLAIARAVAEYVHNHPRLGSKTLFATHYHELTALADTLPRVRNYNVAVSEDQGNVVFLHRIVPGGADRSYGVHVAQLAGMPSGVIHRAWELLKDLERTPQTDHRAVGASLVGARPRHSREGGNPSHRPTAAPPAEQLSLLGTQDPALDELLSLDINAMTPMDALNKLYELQQKARPQ